MTNFFLTKLNLTLLIGASLAQSQAQSDPKSIPPMPLLVKKTELMSGNPFAGYCELKKMEGLYLSSPLGGLYKEQMKNFEEFMGFPLAGKEAMQLDGLRTIYHNTIQSTKANF